jgi:hypothetical protein
MYRLVSFFIAATLLTSCQSATQQVADEEIDRETTVSSADTSASEDGTERQGAVATDSGDAPTVESSHSDDETTTDDASEDPAREALIVLDEGEEGSADGMLNRSGGLGERRGSGERESRGYGEHHAQSEEESPPASGHPTVIPGTPRVHGNIESEVIQRVMRRYRSQLRDCYETILAEGDGFSGRLVIAATISSTGEVLEGRVTSADFERPGMEECVLERLREWDFPEPRGGGIVRFQYPFLFQLD